MQRVSHFEIVHTENQATRTKCERCARFKYGMKKNTQKNREAEMQKVCYF